MTEGDRELLRRFEGAEIPLSEFSHATHVRLAWIYLHLFGLLEAMAGFRSSLKRYVGVYGKAEKYNETITIAYLLLIHERVRTSHGEAQSWDEFSRANRDLIEGGLGPLLKMYAAERLHSVEAKERFILP